MYQNPKSTKQEIKLWAFYLVDIGIIAGLVFIANYIDKMIHLSPAMTFIYYGISVVFGIFLCAKTPSHPTERNFQVLLNLLKMDRSQYHSFEIKNYTKER